MRVVLFVLALLFCSVAGGQSFNSGGTIIASAAATSTQINSADIQNTGYRGVHVIVNVSAYTSGTYTAKIQGKDPVSGNYYDLLVGPAIGATGITVLKIYPSSGQVANGAAADFLPAVWRVQLNGASTPSMTLSVGAFSEI